MPRMVTFSVINSVHTCAYIERRERERGRGRERERVERERLFIIVLVSKCIA